MPGVMAPMPKGKTQHYGIEVADKLIWRGWEPGREYTQTIILKNVKVKTQKLKYRGPMSRFFSTLYPKPIVLSAGTSYTLPVTFRPLEKVIYDDRMEFETKDGVFVVPMQAVLPEVDIDIPSHIDFSMCAAQDLRQLSFEIKNASELETPFLIECSEPFQVEPSEGTLEPYGAISIIATFTPKAAVVYEADIVVRYGPDHSHSKVTKMEGIGKYPHLLVKSSSCQPEGLGATETMVDFGQVSVGKTVDKWIELCNISPVNVPFTVEHPIEGPSKLDTVFQCLQKEGVVPAMSSIRLPISFRPSMVATRSVDYFHVKAIGNISKTVINCTGSSKGPLVHLSHSIVNFMQIDAGLRTTKTIDIINQSDSEAVYQFQLDSEESVFKVDQPSGVLPPNTKQTIMLHFQPVHPINYYRRVSCLVHNQMPLFMDLLGTCHTETMKPAVLQSKHLKWYKSHVDRGLSYTAPEQLNQQLRDGLLKVDRTGALYKPEEGNPDESSQPSGPLPTPMDEYFNDGYHSDFTHTRPHVSMDVREADFGRCTDLYSVQQQTVNITNHTNGKITVVWMGDAGHTFSVSPSMLDIPPQGSSSFTVSFKPNAPNQFYGSELECYAYYKSLRDYRLVEDRTHCPPWCMTLTATGHTFLPNNETFLPRYMLDPEDLIFPAVNANESTYRTLVLSNVGTTPLLFDFDKDPDQIFNLKPTKGLLLPSAHQLCVVKCLPRAIKTYKQMLKLHLNAAEKNDVDLSLLGSAEMAEIQLEDDGEMYFKQTCIGTRSVRKYAIKNISRIPLHFEWKMHHRDEKLLSVMPSSGLIEPNEKQYHTWSFMPKTREKFIMKPTLICWGKGRSLMTSGGKKRKFSVRAIGEGTIGEIKCDDIYVHFGNVVVGTQSTRQLVIYNDSSSNLEYKLDVQQEMEGPYPEEQTRNDPLALILEKTEGVIAARSKEFIQCTCHPIRRVCYQWSISYQLCLQQVDDLDTSLTESQFLCHVLANGVFPTMSITDAHCYGSAASISKKQLWDLFSLDNLNACLDSDPCSTELKYTISTRQSYERKPPVMTRAILDFNFSAAPVNSDPCIVQLMFENTGLVSCDWSFLFPDDLQLEIEYWSETGEYDDDELHQMKVMDNKLFTVEPKAGHLEPGQCQTIRFVYNHLTAGTDRIPVLLKLTRGREILLNFVGVTVEPERHYLHFPSSRFMFSPVAIGEKNPPKQIYELYNGGALAVKYELDTTNLEMLKQENFDHYIFEVLNPMGEILPGHTHIVEWRFSPLEAKTYMVDIPIQIHNGETAIVTFTGVGYDKRALGDTMPVTDNHDRSGVPSIQTAPIPGQLCFLSQERLSFGNIPLFTRPRRIVVISNQSQQHGVIFKWHVTSSSDAKIVSIQPQEGRLAPGAGQICKVTFVSFGFPSFYDIDLICETINMTDYNRYEAELNSWYAEKSRQRVEFTIEREPSVTSLTDFREYEKKLQTWSDQREQERVNLSIASSSQRTESQISDESRPPSSHLMSLEKMRTPSPEETDFIKYKTLPPIRQCTLDNEQNREKARKRFKKHHWPRPEPPKPFLLHLGVTARTHNMAEFQQDFPDDYAKFCVDRTLCSTSDENDEPKPVVLNSDKVKCLSSEADVVAGALTDILRALLDDAQFQESCHEVINAPIPYYKQFIAEKRRQTPPRTGETEASQLTEIELHVGSERGSPQQENIWSPMPNETAGVTHASAAKEDYGNEMNLREQSARSQPRTSTRRSDSHGSPANSDRSDSGMSDLRHMEKQTLKKLPEFGSTVESVIENTLLNIIQEAFNGEFNITARPRLVALPPRPTSTSSLRK